jgi:hypothetical protein
MSLVEMLLNSTEHPTGSTYMLSSLHNVERLP